MGDPSEKINIVRDDVEAAGTCTRRQFDAIWEPRGWREASEADLKKTPVRTPSSDAAAVDAAEIEAAQRSAREASRKSAKTEGN